MSMAHLIARKAVCKRNSTSGRSKFLHLYHVTTELKTRNFLKETSANATSLPNLNVHLIITFDDLHATGVALLLAILLVAYLSPKIRRKTTWYMVVVVWIVISLSNLMLPMGEQTGPEPGATVCFVQAMFVYALPPFNYLYVHSFESCSSPD